MVERVKKRGKGRKRISENQRMNEEREGNTNRGASEQINKRMGRNKVSRCRLLSL